ncbi:unnamed protein product [Peronospora belbahrii]|uniref:Uncharacterized protein n=1 Tax=Peronospora belbahrii TaxID=622444 RepID=A0ABN8D564_9STRA|nr:unnamed protein product [Peronospora belbahrii]
MNTDIITSDTFRSQTDYVTPPSILCAAERQLRKSTHLAAPHARVQDGVAVKNIHTGALLKTGKTDGRFRWLTTASAQCPLVESETAIWAAAGAAELQVLLNQVQFFRFPGKLNNSRRLSHRLVDRDMARGLSAGLNSALQDKVYVKSDAGLAGSLDVTDQYFKRAEGRR